MDRDLTGACLWFGAWLVMMALFVLAAAGVVLGAEEREMCWDTGPGVTAARLYTSSKLQPARWTRVAEQAVSGGAQVCFTVLAPAGTYYWQARNVMGISEVPQPSYGFWTMAK